MKGFKSINLTFLEDDFKKLAETKKADRDLRTWEEFILVNCGIRRRK